MVKGNQAVPKVHQRKHYHPCSSQRGNIKVFLGQPKHAQSRRRRRIIKAKKVFPRPVKALRPVVACPTIRYNFRKRFGRGFTPEEIRAAGVTPRYVATIGVRVDARRRNISEESLRRNADRLRTYLGKLVLFPLSRKAAKQGEASPADQAAIQQNPASQVRGASSGFGLGAKRQAAAPRKVAKKDVEQSAYKFLKKNLSAVRFLGARLVRARKQAEAKAKDEEAKKKK